MPLTIVRPYPIELDNARIAPAADYFAGMEHIRLTAYSHGAG